MSYLVREYASGSSSSSPEAVEMIGHIWDEALSEWKRNQVEVKLHNRFYSISLVSHDDSKK